MDKLSTYIKDRIQDLAEDRSVSTNASDRMWMARVMQELDWAHQVYTGEYSKGCVLSKEEK